MCQRDGVGSRRFEPGRDEKKQAAFRARERPYPPKVRRKSPTEGDKKRNGIAITPLQRLQRQMRGSKNKLVIGPMGETLLK